jgi:ribonuclease Y
MLFGVIGLVVGAFLVSVVAWIRAKQAEAQTQAAKHSAARIIDEAKKDAAAIKKEAELHAKDSVLKERGEFEKEVRETRRELQTQEKRIIGKEEAIDKRIESVDKRESDLTRREQSLKSREKNLDEKAVEYDRQIDQARRQLEQVAGMTRDEAKKSLIDQMVDEAKHESAKRIRLIEEEAKEESARKSQKIIALAIERLAGDFVAERSVTVFPLPNDELKGKIIGR